MKDDIFRLVKSLNTAEKRKLGKYFNGSKSYHRQLFDKIKRQKKYNENRLKKSLFQDGQDEEKAANTFSVVKNQLISIILNEIREVHTPTSKESKQHPSYEMTIRQWLDQIEILHKKGLYDMSLPIIENVKQLAMLAEDWGYLFQLMKFEAYAKGALYTDEQEQLMADMGQYGYDIAEGISNFALLHKLKAELQIMAIRNPLIRSHEQIAQIKEIMNHSIIKQPPKQYYGRLFQQVVQFFGNYLLGNFSEMSNAIEKIYHHQYKGDGKEAAQLKPFERFQTFYCHGLSLLYTHQLDKLDQLIVDEFKAEGFETLINSYRDLFKQERLILSEKVVTSDTLETFSPYLKHREMIDHGIYHQLPLEMQKLLLNSQQRLLMKAGNHNDAGRIYNEHYLSLDDKPIRKDLDWSSALIHLLSHFDNATNGKTLQMIESNATRMTGEIERIIQNEEANLDFEWDLAYLSGIKLACKKHNNNQKAKESLLQKLREYEDKPYVKHLHYFYDFNEKLAELLKVEKNHPAEV